MIGVNINGTFADLAEDTSVQVELFNPIFNDGDVIKGSSSMPFNVPGGNKSELNSRLLKNPDVIENVESSNSIDSTLFFSGIPWKRGILRTKGFDKNTIQANYIFGLATVAEDFKTVKLRDIVTGVQTIHTNQLTKGFYIKNNVAFGGGLKIKINGKEITATSLADLRFKINQNEQENKVTALDIVSGTTPGGAAAPACYVFVNTMLGGDDHDPTWPISVAAIEDTETEKAKWYIEPLSMTSYNSAITNFANPANTVLKFPLLFNDKLFGDAPNPKPNNIINGWNSTGYLLNTISNGSFLVNNRTSFQCFIKLRYVLDVIEAAFGVEFEGDWITDADTANMLIDNSACLDVSVPYIGNTNFIFIKRSFSLSELVPDITVVAFLKALQNRYNLAMYQNEYNGKIVLRKREPIAKQTTYTDITALSSPVLSIEDQRLTGIRLSAKIDENDSKALTDEYVTGEVEEEIKTDISGLGAESTTGQVDGETGTVMGPSISRKAGEKFGFRIFYSKGSVNNGTFTYQGASINATAYDERFSGANGLYEKNWKAWLAKRISRRVVNLEVSFPFRTIRSIEYDLKHRFDRKNFLIYSISVQLSMDGIKVSKVKLYTC